MLNLEIIEKYKYDAQGLAKYYASEYLKTHDRVFPINPFQVLSDLGIHFVFRNFEKLEGLFLPATDENSISLVAINANRPITRQRFSAAHELCHYLKDSGNTSFMCAIASDDYIEKYAESFASAFLMLEDEIQEQIALRGRSEGLILDDVLIISDHFGTSFRAYYYRIRSLYPYLLPYASDAVFDKYKPDRKRSELGLTYTNLYFDLFDAWNDIGNNYATDFARQVFKNHYVFNDARREKVNTSYEATAEIVENLQRERQLSKYCTEEYEYYCHVAGHAVMYDYIYGHANDVNFSVYAISSLNAKLFSCFPNPEYGGKTRQSNPIVLGAKFETVDWRDVMPELIRYDMAPLYIKIERKEEYLAALELADKRKYYDKLYECIMKGIIQTHVEMAERPR